MTLVRSTLRWIPLVVICGLALGASVEPVLAQCGTRWAARPPAGNNSPSNNCLSSATPCNSINHAIAVACAGDAVEVGEGTWTEDILIDRRVFVDSSGVNANTFLKGTGATDTVRIFSSGAQLNGFALIGPNSNACIRIGDASHPNLRTVQLTNLNVSGCSVGVVVDSIGPTGDWVRINGNIISNNVADGSLDGGTGVLIVGGAGRLEIRQSTLNGNGGPAIKLLSGNNGTLEIGADQINNNGRAPLASSHAGVEFHRPVDLRMEGNLLTGHTGSVAGDDGRAVLIDGANGVGFFCNEMRSNDGGLSITGLNSSLSVLQNRFNSHTGPAIQIASGGATGVQINESMIYGNGQGLVNQDTVAVNARHNWWGTADGPIGAGGTGNAVSGPVDVSSFIARTVQPVLARQPALSGWNRSTGACYDTLQTAIDNTPTNGLLLLGAGEIPGHVTITRAIDLEGVAGRVPLPWCDYCQASVIDGTQYTGTRTPALKITNVSGMSLRNISLRGAGLGTPACYGGHQETEIGLDLQNVKNSVFQGLSVRENGTTEIRVFGDSDDNWFDDVIADGMIRDGDNEDRCGHRSREAFLIDGGPRACESGAGALAERNRITNSETDRVTRGVKLRYANGTEIATSSLQAVGANDWPDTTSVSIWVEASSDTNIHDNPAIAGLGTSEALRIVGSTSCQPADSARTSVDRSTIIMGDRGGLGVHLVHNATDNGAPVDTRVNCSTITGVYSGIFADWVGGAQVTLTDIVSSTYGVQNNTADMLPVTQSWWGSASGPSGAGPGSGTSVTAGVNYSPFLASSSRDDADGDGVTECQGDMDDTNALIHPFDGCDGFDNDLDGTLDENFAAQATSCGVGPCRSTGVTSCVAGAVRDSCTPLSPPSTTDATCDGTDDNCNGQTDEGYPSTPTSCGVGACARTGAISCVGGGVQNTCSPGAPLSTTDTTCDNVDDNCNGQTDENFVPGPTTCGLGYCASTGTSSCSGGVFQDTCQPGPPLSQTDVTCDGTDDNCNGQVDDGFAPTTTTCGVGVCQRSGTTSCSAGSVQDSCVAGAPEAPDDAGCNGRDEDCDGTNDEDYVPQSTVCGLGACAALGSLQCQSGTIVENCTPGTPTTETCNQIDDDCDGIPDDHIPAPSGPSAVRLRMVSVAGSEVSWERMPLVQLYDVVRGSVTLLQQSGGDYTAATDFCLINDLGEQTSWVDVDLPPTGDGFWYLVRAIDCAGISSYDAGENGLVGSRDAELAASPYACP